MLTQELTWPKARISSNDNSGFPTLSISRLQMNVEPNMNDWTERKQSGGRENENGVRCVYWKYSMISCTRWVGFTRNLNPLYYVRAHVYRKCRSDVWLENCASNQKVINSKSFKPRQSIIITASSNINKESGMEQYVILQFIRFDSKI